VDVSHRASLNEAWKRYAARVFHNWSKEARGTVLPRFVYSGFVPGPDYQLIRLLGAGGLMAP